MIPLCLQKGDQSCGHVPRPTCNIANQLNLCVPPLGVSKRTASLGLVAIKEASICGELPQNLPHFDLTLDHVSSTLLSPYSEAPKDLHDFSES